MYSGTTFRVKSGRVMGVHQRIDRLARRSLEARLDRRRWFPSSQEILHFEGLNGPDGIKRKSPSRDEPWHYVDPTKPEDRVLIGMIDDHIHNLAHALRDKNRERAAFEAAWLAHAVVDGLTPAHHYPLGDKIEELWGKPHHERDSVRDKNFIRGHSALDTFKKNWEYWGSGGIFTAHFMFEWGVATTASMMTATERTGPNGNDYIRVEQHGFEVIFYESLHKVAAMGMYEEFIDKGWTHHLASETRSVLTPEIVKCVALAWYQAILKADKLRAR